MGIPSQPTTVISLGPRSGQPNSNRSLATEFGDSSPHALGDFYRGGPLVANHPVNSGVPTTIGGTRSLSQYNGASIVHRYTISSPVQNLNLFDYATNPARTGTTKSQGYIDNGQYTAGEPGAIEFTISPGVVVGSATRTQNSLQSGVNHPTTGGWHPSVSILVINQGTIVGAGGNGGNAGLGAAGATPATPAQPGFAGGTAVAAQRPFIFQNAGTIRGGSGGGGGGEGIENVTPLPGGSFSQSYSGGGGGGGAGQSGGPGGTVGIFPPGLVPGQAGTLTTGGAGSAGYAPGKAGGSGGNAISPTVPGAGQAGQGFPVPFAPGFQGGAGGAAGYAVTGNNNITWQATGTINGQRIA